MERSTRARNLTACEAGSASCDFALLSPSESAALATAERQRNYRACVTGRGYCDRSRLTPLEALTARPQPTVAMPAGNQP